MAAPTRSLGIIPHQKRLAAENMAADWLMLSAAAGLQQALMRTYGWAQPAATFGYTQRWVEVTALTRAWEIALVRRPSAGGLVDHRDDWTFAMAIPRGWWLAESPPAAVYGAVHGVLAKSLQALGVEATLAGEFAGDPLQCFVAPVRDDVVDPRTGRKLAGAALKRSREGFLLQGSLVGDAARLAGPSLLERQLAKGLAELLEVPMEASAWQPEGLDAWPALCRKVASRTWNERR